MYSSFAFVIIFIFFQLLDAETITNSQLDPSLKKEKKAKISVSQSISDIVSKATRKLHSTTNANLETSKIKEAPKN